MLLSHDSNAFNDRSARVVDAIKHRLREKRVSVRMEL